MSNKAYHAEEKRGTKKRKTMRQGNMPRKAQIAEKNKRRSFKLKFDNF